jgi:hypothetical protein
MTDNLIILQACLGRVIDLVELAWLAASEVYCLVDVERATERPENT